jgi:acetyl-CoA carboxylase biotin carboxyl carrier protein
MNMDLVKTTSQLADILKEKNLSSIAAKFSDDGLTVEVFLEDKPRYTGVPAGHGTLGAPLSNPDSVTPASVSSAPEAALPKSGNFVKSPLIGTFYSAPAPDKPPFVKVGDKVEVGQVVCIVESMKLMNEVTSEFAGTVAEVLVKDGEAVEFGKELIRVE